MRTSELITRAIDTFYVWPATALLPRQTFRYAVCGVVTLGLDMLWYAFFYNFVFDRMNFDLGFIVISPHVAALILVFPFTFFTGFWLNRYVAFPGSPVPSGTQLGRYALSVVGAILLSYGCIKFFVEVCGIWPTPSKFITNGITALYSYLAARFFTFRDASHSVQP